MANGLGDGTRDRFCHALKNTRKIVKHSREHGDCWSPTRSSYPNLKRPYRFIQFMPRLSHQLGLSRRCAVAQEEEPNTARFGAAFA